MFINRKVVYKNDIETSLDSFIIKKMLFTYPLKMSFRFINTSAIDIVNLTGDFVLTNNDKIIETITIPVATKKNPLLSNTFEANIIPVKFKKKFFTKKEFENYTIKIYLYKDEKYKTLVSENKLPKRSFGNN